MNTPDRRLLILEAASRLFQHYGPFKTTVADIAKEARVGVGTVYLEFRSKDAILGALSSRRHETVLSALERAFTTDRAAEERLTDAFTARLEAFLACATGGTHARDLFAGSCAVVDRAHGSYQAAEEALLLTFLRDAMQGGQLAIRDPAETSRALLYAYRAFAPPFAFEYPGDRLRADIHAVHHVVVLGLRPR